MGSGCKFGAALCPCGLNISTIAKAFPAFQMCPTCVPPSGQSGSWAVIYLMGQFSKSMTFCLGSDPFMCSSGVSPAVQKLLYKIAFLSSFLSMISPILSGLFSLQTKCGDLFSQSDTHLVQLSPCLRPSNERKFKKQ